MKKINWHWIERVGTWSTMIGMAIALIVTVTRYRVIVDELKKSDEKQDEYIKNQNEINGKFLILYDYFIVGGAGSEEEEN